LSVIALARRYAVALIFLAGFELVQLSYQLMNVTDRSVFTAWASTSVANLEHDPVGCLAVSAFVGSGSTVAWPALIALAMFGANRALGNVRTLVVCVAGQVVGTLVSEGIVDYRVDHGLLPVTARHITDVGPSYVVVSAIVAAVVFGSRAARVIAVIDLGILVFVGQIFSGFGRLEVAAVGHFTAMVTAGFCCLVILVRRWRARARAMRREWSAREIADIPA
jgi:hypothetical protein